MTVTQLPAIRPIVSSVFAFYPPCDFTVTHHQKSRLRRYKAGVGGFRARETDYMLSMSPMIDWSYIPHGTDLRNPLLSPFFAEHDMLPRRVMIIGCELDMYAHEAWRTISKLAGREVPAMEQTVGREGQSDHGQMLFDDDRFHFEQTYNDGSSYKWLLVPDTSKWCESPAGLRSLLTETVQSTTLTSALAASYASRTSELMPNTRARPASRRLANGCSALSIQPGLMVWAMSTMVIPMVRPKPIIRSSSEAHKWQKPG